LVNPNYFFIPRSECDTEKQSFCGDGGDRISNAPKKNTDNEADSETVHKTKSDKDLEHDKKPIAKKTKLIRITNWYLKITSELHKLKKIGEGLLNDGSVKALRGQYEHSNSSRYPTLHMTVKFSKQMTRPSVMKIITTFVVDTTNVQIYLHSLNNPEEIKASLKLTSKFTPETKTETDLKKGKDFTYTGKKKIQKEKIQKRTIQKNKIQKEKIQKEKIQKKALLLIEEKGITRAGREWARQYLPPKLFDNAVEHFLWCERMIEQKKRRLAAEKQVSLFYPWQRFLWEQLKQVPDEKTIWMVIDKNGINGKTFFQGVLQDLRPRDVLLLSVDNTTKNIQNLHAKQRDIKIVFINIPRLNTKLDLASVETLKKYHGLIHKTDPPHVVLFSNKPPCWKDLTENRWKILHITAKEKCAYQDDAFEILSLSEYISATNTDGIP